MNEEVWALGQAKGQSQKFEFSKYCSESTFVNGFFIQLDVVVTTAEVRSSAVKYFAPFSEANNSSIFGGGISTFLGTHCWCDCW